MAQTDKFCRRWNQHLENIGGALQECRAEVEFSDVTLACEDDEIKGHKVILSASSPILRGLLQRYPHPKPLIYLRGVRGRHLAAIVDFIYRGEVDMEHSELATFLDLARDLQIKGLVRDTQKKQEPEQDAGSKGTGHEKQEASDKEAGHLAGKICSEQIVDTAGERTVGQNIVEDQGSDIAKVVVKEEFVDDLTENDTNVEEKRDMVQEESIESQPTLEGGHQNKNLTNVEVNEAKVLEDLVESCNAKAKVLDELVEPKEAGDELPSGWRRGAHRRLTGKHEYFIVTDLGLKFRSQVQVDNFLRYHNMKVQVRLKPSVEIIGELLKKSDECKAKETEKKIDGNKVENENKPKLEQPRYFYNVQEGDDVDAIIISMMKINDDHLTCTVCGLSKPSQVKMKNHIEQHIGGTSYTCNLCQKVFRTRYILGSHSRREHGIPWDFKNSQRKNLAPKKNENIKTVKTYSKADIQSEQKYFYTIQPGDDIDSIVALMIEKKDAAFSCKVCNVIKYVPSHMEDHVETHIGGTSYVCSVCKKQRRTRVSLKLHMYKAHGENPYKRI